MGMHSRFCTLGGVMVPQKSDEVDPTTFPVDPYAMIYGLTKQQLSCVLHSATPLCTGRYPISPMAMFYGYAEITHQRQQLSKNLHVPATRRSRPVVGHGRDRRDLDRHGA